MEAENRVQNPHDAKRNDKLGDVETVDARPGLLNRFGLFAAVALGGFILGFVPMFLSSTTYREDLTSVMKTLRPSVLQNDLATATINARRGEYEQARQQTSGFFTDLRAELEKSDSAFTADQTRDLKAYLAQRDDLITLLARSDSASADQLTDLYFNYLQLKNTASTSK